MSSNACAKRRSRRRSVEDRTARRHNSAMIRSRPSSVQRETLPTRRSLLERIKAWEDHAGWQEFFDTYWGLIYGVARQAGLNDAEAQDVVQETIVAVAKNIGDFDYDPGRGSFKNWLLQQTRWRIQGHFRKKQYQRDGQQLPREVPLDTTVLEQKPAPLEIDL